LEYTLLTMRNQLLYLKQPDKLEFDAAVLQRLDLPDAEIGLILDQSYFYPSGGGQEYDMGTIGAARVTRVYKDSEEGSVIHVVDRDVPLGNVHACIDPERRLRHMQHHTAQHLLTQCFLRVLNLDTISAHINGYTPSSLDLPAAALSPDNLVQVEDLANRIIFEDRVVKSYFVTPEELEKLPVRRKAKVSEDIRIVEIDGFDYTPCGGTHCSSTGTIGMIKILRTERPNKDTVRVSFAAGLQALSIYREYHAIISSLVGQFGVSIPEITGAVQRQAEQLRSTQADMQGMQNQLLALEARKLAENPERIGSRRFILAAFEGRPVQELRALSAGLKEAQGLVSVLSTWEGGKLSLLVVCAPGGPVSARDLLNPLLALIGGRGGGDKVMAQGGGAADAQAASSFADQAREIIRQVLS
jgi:alanyl-tRNA synthetase